jgi:serine/threonine protein kinase
MQPSPPSICPSCHSPIPDDAPGGLCPACTLEKAATVPHPTTGGRHTQPPSVGEIAPHFPDLEILELLGAGGMGAVYKARQPQLDRTVALKILSHDLAQDPAFVERFSREARMLARLSHPNIVGIFDFGTAGPYCYLLMEHVDGVNLRQAMRTGGFKPAEALALVQEMCSALQFAHDEGILHRDIKPENVLIDSKGRVKIADFGIAKLVGDNHRHDVTLTIQGSVLGSPHYMAPEQIETPGDVDQRADIYSLGVVLYEMLTGELPIGRFAPPSKKTDVDARIDEIVLRTLEKERELRYQSVGEVKTHVEAAKDGGATPRATSSAAESRSVSGGSPMTARFASASCVCTALSFPLGLLFKFTMFLAFDDSPLSTHEGPPSSITQFLLPLLALTLFAATGLLGFGFGVRALLEMRASSGHKQGLFRVMFGSLAWPVVLVFQLSGLLFRALCDVVESTNDGLFAAAAIIVGLAASTFLIRRVDRWIKCGTATNDHQGTGAPPPGPAAFSGGAREQSRMETAKFATTSAVCSGISIIFGIIVACLFASFGDLDDVVRNIGAGWALFYLVATLGTAITGFILGASALGAIRKSGGTKEGLGCAIFAVTPWPIVFLALLTLSSLMVPLPDGAAGSISSSLALLFVGIPLLLAGFVLIRGLRRWARGVEMKDGQNHFPGLTGTVLATLGLAVLGPVLAVGIPILFPASGPHDSLAGIEAEMSREMRETKPVSMVTQWTDSETNLDAMKDIDWQGGRPDLTWKITVESGLKTEMRLILKDEDGSIRLFDLGECASQINGSPGQGRLEVGTVLPTSDEAVSDTHAMTVAFQTGRENKLIHSFEDLRGFHFFDSHRGELVLDGAGTRIFPFATRFADAQQQLATGTLSLEVIVKGTGEK